ncbi:hypothetical protein Sjap_005047 [Stephania japonica]|uniref:Uncharacterized protein n=1 Tax=Stephania japonica TaxID=461633 RepID=A0AAP0K4M8_9MAGN
MGNGRHQAIDPELSHPPEERYDHKIPKTSKTSTLGHNEKGCVSEIHTPNHKSHKQGRGELSFDVDSY